MRFNTLKNPKAPQGRHTFSPARERRVWIDYIIEALKGRHFKRALGSINMSPFQGFNII
jgi:hypothetical protein